MTMTLKHAARVLRDALNGSDDGVNLEDVADAIDAHLKAVREVVESHINEAKNLRHDPELQNYLYEQADKLETAINRVD